MSDDEELQRQRREISMFAAMALGGAGAFENFGGDAEGHAANSEGSNDKGVVSSSPNSRFTSDVQTDDTINNSSTYVSESWASNAPSKATSKHRRRESRGGPPASNIGAGGGTGDAGTFNLKDAFSVPYIDTGVTSGSFQLSDPNSNLNVAEESNLAAAAAALTAETDPAPDSDSANFPTMQLSSLSCLNEAAQQQGAAAHNVEVAPMFAEQVFLPRPLFFGAVLPPRVLKEGRNMVHLAMKDLGLDPAVDPVPSLQKLPDAVRNLVGAIRTYGFGLADLLLENSSNQVVSDLISSTVALNVDESNDEYHKYWKGNPYLSTYQPVWGESVRAERIREFRKRNRPLHIARASTAPSRLGNYGSNALKSGFVSPTPSAKITSSIASTGSNTATEIGYAHNTRYRNTIQAVTLDNTLKSARTFPGSKSGQVFDGNSQTNNYASAKHSLSSQIEKCDSIGVVESTSNRQIENEQFGMWIKGDDDTAPHSTGSFGSLRSSEESQNAGVDSVEATPLSEQDLFSKWVQAGDQSTLRVISENKDTSDSSKPIVTFDPSTFQRLQSPKVGGNDDDSVVDDENKKQVGLNEHLSKAIASLLDDSSSIDEITASQESKIVLAQVPFDDAKARPLSNYELTNGCIPLYGVDDAPLPVESDLGVHETKEEQQRSNEVKRSQDIIEKYVSPNVFGPITCPNPALSPDDFHSWNSRASSSHRTNGGSNFPAFPKPSPSQFRRSKSLDASSAASGQQSTANGAKKNVKRYFSKSRYGWWNVDDETPEQETDTTNGDDDNARNLSGLGSTYHPTKQTKRNSIKQLPPMHHSSSALQVVTRLEPKPQELCESNLPLSCMHAATTVAQSLPYLSDRPPSHRFLQIDTQAVGFLPVVNELEPLFCSLAIYNIETLYSGIGGSQEGAPLPDLQRCGRVTETLQFDIVSDQSVASRCNGSLWPYSRSVLIQDATDDSLLQGTRCGVFPIPSGLQVANLYAVLIVRKVFADDADFDPYLNPNTSSIDYESLKARAEKNSNRYGQILMPFAFGVAPLLQVFGTGNPIIASSRAVQIPLFKYSGGERVIINHVMVMLYPRADHHLNSIGGPAPVTNGGRAMLVMRNFGYLGLHTVVDQKSSLARDRLVDFTGEIQIRARGTQFSKKEGKSQGEPYSIHLPEWHASFIAEPTVNGGRNRIDSETPNKVSRAHLYAQELAPLPLQSTPSQRDIATSAYKSGMSRGRLHGNDIEPFYYTSFCNEMLLQPRLLHNCSKDNVVIKVELREVEWKQDLNGYFAHLPRNGPSIHNGRRGPFLVQNAYTSCSRSGDHQYMDEFKVKLPLDLKPGRRDGRSGTLSLFFTVYTVTAYSKGTWKRAKSLFGSTKSGETTAFDDQDEIMSTRLKQLSCGFLPMTSQASLIENGIHDVRIVYVARPPPIDLVEKGLVDSSSLVLLEKNDLVGSINGSVVDNYFAEDPFVSHDSALSDIGLNSDSGTRREQGRTSFMSEAQMRNVKGKEAFEIEPLSLSVRIAIFSSIHSQNDTLATFFQQEPDFPRVIDVFDNTFMSTLGIGRDLLKNNETFLKKTQRLDSKLLKLTKDVANYQVCGVHQSSVHLMRLVSILWRAMVVGTGEVDLSWANPGSSLPLRVHSFATLLYVVGSTSTFLSRNGVTRVDGASKWDVATLSRVLSAAFDEKLLFGNEALEILDEEKWMHSGLLQDATNHTGLSQEKDSTRRHVRQTSEVHNDFVTNDLRTKSLSGSDGDASAKSGDIFNSKQLTFPHLNSKFSCENDASMASTAASSVISKQIKMDSKADFQSVFRSAFAQDDGDGFESENSTKSVSQIFGSASSGRGRFMTAPTRALSTIRETNDEDIESTKAETAPSATMELKRNRHAIDEELVLTHDKSSVKQFRKPDLKRHSDKRASTLVSVEKLSRPETVKKQSSVPKNEEIEEAGAKFLDSLGGSFGSRILNPAGGEERRVGSSYHRKTRSRSSIDWSVIMEENPSETFAKKELRTKAEVFDVDDSMSTLRIELSTTIELPDFADRLQLIGKYNPVKPRWFPYTYEVIIMQWHALLLTQRRTAEQSGPNHVGGERFFAENESLAQAAVRAIGVAVACAPLLFEIIKQSLGHRVASLYRVAAAKHTLRLCPPLVSIDDTLTTNLVQLISMVTDACLDSRNFDSWELRQMSIDVNDSIIRFLRDMFSFLTPSLVFRMILIYLSRFVTKEGKQWQDRDSSIGLRCSWEITKLRLNAVTALVRFPDFIRVNSPQVLTWKANAFLCSSESFFDSILKRFEKYRLSDIVGCEDFSSLIPKADVPTLMTPHWLSELVIDVCLLGIEHAEQYIQNRSGSLLHELFWFASQFSILRGTSAAVGGMFLSMLCKILPSVSYLSNFAPKSQLRRDIIPCLLYVLQATPANLLRALWRQLFNQLFGKGRVAKFGGIKDSRLLCSEPAREELQSSIAEHGDEVGILDMFSLFNLALKTMEYEGAEEHLEYDSASHSRESVDMWRKEYILTPSGDFSSEKRDSKDLSGISTRCVDDSLYTSTVSRKWQAHDASLIIVCTTHQIVLEMYQILNTNADGKALLNPAVGGNRPLSRFFCEPIAGRSPAQSGGSKSIPPYKLDLADTVVFVRGAASIYLHALSLKESDLVIIRCFRTAAEALKIFGIKLFLEALGETLQHWMRIVSLHCGARRAQVRVEATDFLELILRSTWECYGSFFRIRVPLLAVQTEVMERIVATAAARYYRDQRKDKSAFENFSNLNAEASLVPLWRTLDRIEKQPASQNIAFRGALIRMAEKLKKLYRAYVAARVLSFIQGARAHTKEKGSDETTGSHETEAKLRARRICVLRVINASEGYSKQFLGFQATTQNKSHLAHYEAVEDALIDAADVFSPTELPEHRVAWLRMLADFHASRKKYAEEATCHFYIHATLRQASQLHGSLWSNTPFLPWTDNIPDPVYIDGEGPAVDADFTSEIDFDGGEGQFGRQTEGANSFRRIFYRVANSVGMSNNDWETGESKNLFYGVTSSAEYQTVKPWITLREMEENMVEEAEAAAELYLKSGVVQSSRFAWNLATQYYSDKFNYGKLSVMYGNLSRAVVTEVPPIDTTLPMEVSAILGRFYRVWFHGGAPDSLSGVEFVYRTDAAVRLDQFGEELKDVIKSIIPDKTPIHLLLDGRAEERIDEGALNFGFSRVGPAPLEPVRIKVTPLRPISRAAASTRGRPEWFLRYVDEAFSTKVHRSTSDLSQFRRSQRPFSSKPENSADPRHRERGRSFSATFFSSTGSSSIGPRRVHNGNPGGDIERSSRGAGTSDADLAGSDKFCFVQPRDRKKVSKEWWKAQSGDFAEKTLKVTQLQVTQAFPACVSRQEVVHRLVYSQSPLEAGVEAICQWCAVLFRTAVATVGQAVLGQNAGPGIGTDAAKVVADCIHSSDVKEMGLTLLQKNSDFIEGDSSTDFSLDYDRLTEDEIRRLRMKIARIIVVFIELLHLLVARNRDLLLDIIQERKKGYDALGVNITSSARSNSYGRSISLGDSSSDRLFTQNAHRRDNSSPHTGTPSQRNARFSRDQLSINSDTMLPPRFPPPPIDSAKNLPRAVSDIITSHVLPSDSAFVATTMSMPVLKNKRGAQALLDDQSTIAAPNTRTDSAIAVQSELQRAFISLCRLLYPRIQGVMNEETPKWLKQCMQDSYFSLGTYRQTKIPIAEELCFNASENINFPSGEPMSSFNGHVTSEMDCNSIGRASSHSAISRGSDRLSASGLGGLV